MTFMAHRREMALGMLTALILSLMPIEAYAEFEATFYSGMSSSRASDVTLSLPNDTHLTFQDVAWDDKSLENPIYWGLRLTYWLPRANNWGVALDFTHAKIHADLGATVSVTGTRAGSAVAALEPLRNTFDELAMSHGYNLLTLNALYRWQVKPRLQPFVGVGGGIAYPHVEVQTGGSYTDEYQMAGWVVNGMAGLNYGLGKDVAIFAEYKLSYADMQADLNGGGSLATTVWTNHFNLGVTYRFAQEH